VGFISGIRLKLTKSIVYVGLSIDRILVSEQEMIRWAAVCKKKIAKDTGKI